MQMVTDFGSAFLGDRSVEEAPEDMTEDRDDTLVFADADAELDGLPARHSAGIGREAEKPGWR